MKVITEPQHKESVGNVETQKNLQWNADRDIPKGAVTGKNHDEAWSPRSGNARAPPASPDHGPVKRYVNSSPRLLDSPDHEPDVKHADSPRRQWDAENEIPKGVVSNIAANRIFFADSPEADNKKPQLSLQKKQWDANKDIPRGKVKGMSNLFAGGNTKREIPENHMEPLDPPGPSPANPYQTEVIKPTPIAASRSEDETSPLQQQTIQEVQATSAFYMANDNVDTNAWTVPVSSSGSHFGQGTWGEEAALSQSNDEFDDQDWFQAGSFNEEDKKTDTEFVAFSDNRFLESADPLLDIEDDEDADLQTTGIGSFAAAIEPVTLRRQSTKPETVAEELEEDDAGSDEVAIKTIPPVESETIDFVNKIARNQAERELANARKLQKLLENTTEDEQPSDVRSTTSKNSRASKGTLLGFRKKSPIADDVSDKKRRGGLFKIFSRKDQSKNEESRWLKTGSDSSTAPPGKSLTTKEKAIKPPANQKVVLTMNVAEPTKTVDTIGSLNKLTEDLEKERAKGIISTRDDMTAVSEMTNPTVFLKQVPSDSVEEKIATAKGNTQRDANEEKVKLTKGSVAKIAKQWPPHVKTSASPPTVEEENSANLSSTVDPFDLNSPIFSNGDPFASPKELDSLQISADDPFADPFFDAFENELRSGSFAVAPKLGGSEHVSNVAESVVEESPKYSFQVPKQLASETVRGDKKHSFDVPDPEIELLSSDDEAENQDPASGLESTSEVVASKVENPQSPTKLVPRFDMNQIQTPSFDEAPVDEIMEMEKQATISIAALSLSGKANTSGTKPVNRSNKFPFQSIPDEKHHREETTTITPSVVRNESSPTNVHGIPTSQPGHSISLGSNMHPPVPVASTVDNSQTPAVSNLSYKIRVKRYEKKMQRAKLLEEPEPPVLAPDSKASEHVSTSAYLNRFKAKGFNRAKASTSSASETVVVGSNKSGAPSKSNLNDSVIPCASSSSADTDNAQSPPLVLVSSHVPPGSRSARRTVRTKGKATQSPAVEENKTSILSKKSSAPILHNSITPSDSSASNLVGDKSLSKSVQHQAKPRSILKKPKLGMPSHSRVPAPLSPYNEKKISDPMHRAGLRLLAAAVIPIQAEMRRFLAKREALNRMWAIVVIQASVRRWLVLRQIDREDEAALIIQAAFADYLTREYARVLIQANVRRWLVQRRMRKAFAATLIQAQFRRWVLEKAYRRLAGAVRIQKCVRGWIAYKKFWLQVLAAIQIQAIFRGWLVRDFVEDQHYCATQIQRIYRGYRATMNVYEVIYKVTLVQSFVRMKIAVEKATYKLAFIIQIQSIIRGYSTRKRLITMNQKAVAIQRHWRGYSMRLNYHLDLLDIILVQSLFRRRIAQKEFANLNDEHRVRCAIIIQSQWRCYDCTMNYLHYLADVLILQSAVRRWIASRYVDDLRHQREFVSARRIQAHVRGFMVRHENKQTKAAVTIQKTWRGFVSYAEYMFTIADIVTAQTQARCWVARRRRKHLLDIRESKAATIIQTQWRGATARRTKKTVLQHVIICQSVSRRLIAKIRFRRNLLERHCAMVIQRFWNSYRVRQKEKAAATSIQKVSRGFSQRNRYAVVIKEHRASILIQAAWRRFWLFSNFIITLDSIIVAQSVVRCYLTRADLRNKAAKATLIQAKQRSIHARRTASAKSMVKALCSASDAIAGKEVESAVIIQTNLRGYTGRSNLFLHRMARIIQTNWRGVIPRRTLEQNRAALRLQTWWRRLVLFVAFNQYMASRRIQTIWRASVDRARYKQYMSSRKIQTAWRMFVTRLAFTRYQAAKKIQATWRCYIAREKYLQWLVTVEAATMIQSAWRSFVCYTDYIFTLADIVTVQRRARGYIHRKVYAKKYEEHQRKIAEQVERDNVRQSSAVHIQRVFRGHVQRGQYLRMSSVVDIQRVFRGHRARCEVYILKRYLAEVKSRNKAALLIQKIWRGYDQKQKFWYVLGCAIQIQCMFRGIAARLRFVDELGSVIVVQSVARRWFAIRNFNQMRLIAYLLNSANQDKLQKHNAATKLQRWYKESIYPKRNSHAAIKIQSFFRMVKAMVDREVKAEKKRRKRRKQQKKNRSVSALDEALLEDAWDSVSPSVTKEVSIAEAAVADVLGKSNSVATRQGRQDNSSGRNLTRSKSRDSMGMKKALLPPSYYVEESDDVGADAPARMVRLKGGIDDSDAMSEVSGLTAPTVFRAPPSRLEQMGEKELTADLSLEEAWVDMEIQNVKTKQKTMAKGKKHKLKTTKTHFNM